MTRSLSLTGLAIVGLLAIASSARAQEALRIDDAIHLALLNNERAQKAPLRIETADGQLDRARTAFYPSLIGSGAGIWNATEDKTGRSITTSGTVTLTQPILSASSFPLYAQAQHQLESERFGAAQDVRILMFDTARAFLQVLTAESVVTAASRRLDTAKANLADAQARADAGLNSTNDVTRAQVELYASQREVTTGQGSALKAHVQLSYLVGKRIDGPLAEPSTTTQEAERFANNAPTQVQTAQYRRLDLRSSVERSISLKRSAEEPLYRLIPTLSGQGQLHLLPDPLSTEKAVNETITLNLTWTIFDNGQRYADRKTRLAQYESQVLDEKALRRSVATDVEIATVALKTAQDAYRIAGDAVTGTTKLTDETNILYKQGLASALEVTDAIGKRYDAEVSAASAKLSMEQAYLDLRFALGLAPLEEGSSK